MKRRVTFLLLLLAAGVALAQEQPTQTFSRNILVEQFTTVNCGWCPRGIVRIGSAINTSTTNIIWIKHHAGFGEDFLTNDIHRAMLEFYGGSGFAPAMMVDRTRFNVEDDGPVCIVGQVSDIQELFDAARQVPSYCKVNPVEVSFNLSTRMMEGEVHGRFGEVDTWDENTRIVVFLIEDSIVGEQHDYTGHGNWTNYVHMGTVRDAITNMWGNPLTVDPSDRTFTYTFSKTLPEECDYRHCRLVAFVYQFDANNINNRPVLNASQSPFLGTVLSVAEADCSSTLRLYPNPAAGRVVIEADASIDEVKLTDIIGRDVYSAQGTGCNQFEFDTRNLPQGIYLVRIRTAESTAIRQLCVTR